MHDVARAHGRACSTSTAPRGLVRVQAGITIRELSRAPGRARARAGEPRRHRRRRRIAGAISTATHGTGARLRNISAQVAELTLVLADGSHAALLATSATPRRSAPRASGSARSASIAEVTLRCVPAFTLRGATRRAPLAETLDALRGARARATTTSSSSCFPTPSTALTRTNNRTDEPPRPRGRASAYANDVLLTNHAFGLLCRAGRRFPARIPQLNRLVTRLAGSSTRVDRSDRIFASPRLVRFTEMEYALPRARTAEAVRARDGARAARAGFAVPFPIEVRTVAADDALLSTAAGRDSGFVAVHMYRGHGVGALLPRRGGDHGRARRSPALGQAPLPDRRDAAPALPRLGSLPGGARAPGPRRAASPTTAPSACSDRLSMSSPRDARCGASARRRRPPTLTSRHSRSSTSTPSGRTRPTSNAAPRASRSGSPASRCAAARCRNACSPATGFAGTLAFTLSEALWLAAARVRATSSSPIPPPTRARCARWPRAAADRARARASR